MARWVRVFASRRRYHRPTPTTESGPSAPTLTQPVSAARCHLRGLGPHRDARGPRARRRELPGRTLRAGRSARRGGEQARARLAGRRGRPPGDDGAAPRDAYASSSRPSPRTPSEAAARFAGFSAESFFDFVLDDHPPSDAAVFGDPGFRALLRAALDEGFRQGPAATPATPCSRCFPGARSRRDRRARHRALRRRRHDPLARSGGDAGRADPHRGTHRRARASADPSSGHVRSWCSTPPAPGIPCPARDRPSGSRPAAQEDVTPRCIRRSAAMSAR